MIPARHTIAGRMVSEFFSGYRMDRAFRRVDISGEGTDLGLPTLLVANHFSWWDGFIQYRLNKRIFRRKLYVMMLEEQLRRNMILNRCGVFSVRKNSRDSIASLRYAAGLLADPGNIVLVFPQGELQSVHIPEIRFGQGVGAILRQTAGRAQVAMNVNLPDYFSSKKPSLSVYSKILAPWEVPDAGTLEKEFARFYSECKLHQQG